MITPKNFAFAGTKRAIPSGQDYSFTPKISQSAPSEVKRNYTKVNSIVSYTINTNSLQGSLVCALVVHVYVTTISNREESFRGNEDMN